MLAGLVESSTQEDGYIDSYPVQNDHFSYVADQQSTDEETANHTCEDCYVLVPCFRCESIQHG